MKKWVIVVIIITLLSGSTMASYSADAQTITWVNDGNYSFAGNWRNYVFLREKWDNALRIYDDQGKLMLEEKDIFSMSVFEDFIAVARMVKAPDYDYYDELFFFGETEEIRENARKHLYFTYQYDYYDKNINKITPNKEIVKYLDDSYSAGAIYGENVSGVYSDVSYKAILSDYYLIAPLGLEDHRKVGLGDDQGNVLIEPLFSLISSYYDQKEDKVYFIMHESRIDEYGETRNYIVKIIDETLNVVFDVPSNIDGITTYAEEDGRIILMEDYKKIRAFTMKGEEILKEIEKSSFYEKNGWYYIQGLFNDGSYDFYKLNTTTNEKVYLAEKSFPGNTGVVFNGFDYFYYKREDGNNPDIKFHSMVGYYFEDDSPRECAFSNIDGYVSNFGYDANYGYLGKKSVFNNLMSVKKNGKVGLMDNTYKEVTEFIYDEIDIELRADRIMAKKNGKYGYLDVKGNEVLPFVYKNAHSFNPYGYAHVEDESGNKLLIDKYGKIIFESKDDTAWFADYNDINQNYVAIEEINRIGWFKNYIYDPNLYVHRISDWAREIVLRAIDEGYVQEDLQYKFNQNITRAEAAELMVKAYEKTMNQDASYDNNPFADTSDPNVIKAYNLGIVTGVSEKQFAPNNLVTREQLCVMFENLLKVLNHEPTEDIHSIIFEDDNDISRWSKNSVYLLYDLGIINGMGDGVMLPQGNASREQTIVMIYNLMDLIK